MKIVGTLKIRGDYYESRSPESLITIPIAAAKIRARKLQAICQEHLDGSRTALVALMSLL